MNIELQPGAYFEVKGKGFTYVGVPAHTAENTEIVVQINPDQKDEALHRVMPIQEVTEHATNIWNFPENFSFQEFTKQFNEQLDILRKSGLIKRRLSGQDASGSIIGKSYDAPTFESVRQTIIRHTAELQYKVKQGFDKLLLVPWGVDIEEFEEAYIKSIKEYFVPLTPPTELITHSDPSPESRVYYQTPKGDLVQARVRSLSPTYIPLKPSQGSDELHYLDSEYKLQTKNDLLTETEKGDLFPGWKVVLIQDFPNFPPDDESEALRIRPQSKAGNTIKEYLVSLRENPLYANESGMTVEEYLMYAITTLETKHLITDFEPRPNNEERQHYRTSILPGNVQQAYRNPGSYAEAYWSEMLGALELKLPIVGLAGHIISSDKVARSVVDIGGMK